MKSIKIQGFPEVYIEKVAATSTHIPDLLCINLSKKEY